ncbi:MAG: flagellar motor protein MotB [Candidatus Acidiferrales bacterium]
MPGTRPIIVIKKKGGHAGHHGGAWKVAYADFVTAMMALFIVLWLLNTSKKIQEAVGGYFRDPKGYADKVASGKIGVSDRFVMPKDNMDQLKDNLEKALKQQVPNFDKLKSQIEMTVTDEGLRIDLLESAKGTFFDSGSQKLSADGQDLLTKLAAELGKLPNKLTIEGHTDAKPYAQGSNYSNWELSADRANSARRLMRENGVRPDQVTQVRGFADQSLRDPDNPLDPGNRRVSVIVQYLPKNGESDQTGSGAEIPASNAPAKLPVVPPGSPK